MVLLILFFLLHLALASDPSPSPAACTASFVHPQPAATPVVLLCDSSGPVCSLYVAPFPRRFFRSIPPAFFVTSSAGT